MKKFNLFILISSVFILLLVACSNSGEQNNGLDDGESNETSQSKYKPEEINPDTDICEVCAMAVANDQYATQIILKNERSLKYDDIGDMFIWMEENSEDDVAAKFVRDFNTEEWINLEDATFVYDEEISTPMGFGVISFKNNDDAEQYIEENGFGEILTVADLYEHDWDMTDHEHDHDHAAHGFHIEGFDMQFTDINDVTVGEEFSLEVNITIHDKALEDARVRYEIWPENDKDNTDWIDANEIDAGKYVANYTFNEANEYHIQIHVEDDEDLHEHMEVEVDVKE